jgi:hypothetical protein
MRQYVDAGPPEPAPKPVRPPVTAALAAKIDCVVTKPPVTKPPVTKPRGGRPPIGLTAMTGAQRQARYRANIPGPEDRAALAPA